MRRILIVGVALLTVLVLAVASGCGNKVPAGAVASVGDGVVTQKQFDEILARAKASYETNKMPFPAENSLEYKQMKAQVVKYLVESEIKQQKAKEMKVEVTEKEVDDARKNIVTSLGGQKRYEAELKKQKVTDAQVRQELKLQVLDQNLQKKVGESVKVDQAEVKKFFDDPKNANQFVIPDTVNARHVLVKTKAQAATVRRLLVKNASDANWKRVAKKYSTDPGSKNSGGDLGDFAKDRMVPEFANAAFGLKMNQISQPVKTVYGYHVIQVTKKTKGSKTTFDQAKAGIEAQLKQEKQTKAWDEWLKKAKADTKVNYAAGYNPEELTASPTPAKEPAPAKPAASEAPATSPSASPKSEK